MDGHTNIGMYAHGLLVAPEKTKLKCQSSRILQCLMLLQLFVIILFLKMILRLIRF